MMQQYKDLLNHIINNGKSKNDRTGVGTTSIFGYQTRFNMNDGFPLVTCRKTFFRGAVIEFIWMVSRGDTNIRFLLDNNVHFWTAWPHKNYELKTNSKISIQDFENLILNDDEFCKKWGDIGPGYGRQFRNYNGEFDQVTDLINNLKTNPLSRRHVVNIFNPLEVNKALLPPCHHQTIWYSDGTNLSCNFEMRSTDVICGLPINIAFYGIFLEVVAKLTNLVAHELIFTGNDVHIYNNHIDGAIQLINSDIYALPTLSLNNITNINNINSTDISIENYNHGKSISFEVAV